MKRLGDELRLWLARVLIHWIIDLVPADHAEGRVWLAHIRNMFDELRAHLAREQEGA